MKSKTYKVCYFLFAWAVRLIFLITPHGRKNQPDIKDGPVLICSNHISASDPVVISEAVNKHQPRFMAKKELFKNPFLGAIIRMLGSFPVDRSGKDAGVLLKAVKMIESGCSVGIFPQGTRRPGVEPETTPVFNGAGLICSKTKVKVLPVFIKTKDNVHKMFRPVHVYIGKVISYEEYTENGRYADDYKHISQYIFDRICRIGKQNV